MEQMQTQELISALVDGQLQGQAFARGVELATADARSRATWATYHLIGDVLRSGENGVASEPSAFVARLQQRLASEHPVGPPSRSEDPVVRPRPEAANDSSFRWKVLAGFASVAAVGAIVWSVVAALPAKPDGAQLAQRGNAPALASGAVMIRDPQLDELLAAHRQLGGASALQMSAGFVRNAAFESTGR